MRFAWAIPWAFVWVKKLTEETTIFADAPEFEIDVMGQFAFTMADNVELGNGGIDEPIFVVDGLKCDWPIQK